MTDVTIRRLEPGDIAIFKRIVRESFSSEPKTFGGSFDEWEAMPDAQWRRRLQNPVFAAFQSGEPVGLMASNPRRSALMGHRAIVTMVYVRESLRGKGVARALLQAVANQARAMGVRRLELGVGAESLAAVSFYRREGFVEIGRFPGGFLDQGREIDQILMMLPLT